MTLVKLYGPQFRYNYKTEHDTRVGDYFTYWKLGIQAGKTTVTGQIAIK